MIVGINDPTIATLAGLVGFDEFGPRAMRSTPRVRGTVAYALAVSLAKRHAWRHAWSDRVDALRVLLAMPLTVASWLPAVGQFIDNGCEADQPVPLLLWIFAAVTRAAPPDPPPLAGADPAWLRQVVAAHGDQPWTMRLLAAMAAHEIEDHGTVVEAASG